MAKDKEPIALYAEALGSAIQAARKKAGLSASEVARRARVSYSTLHHIERGRPPDFKTLLTLATAIGVTIPELVTSAENTGSSHALVTPAVVREPSEPYWGSNGGQDFSVSEAQRVFLDHLGWALLKAARATNRGTTRAILEELVVACGLAIDAETGNKARQDVVKHRAAATGLTT